MVEDSILFQVQKRSNGCVPGTGPVLQDFRKRLWHRVAKICWAHGIRNPQFCDENTEFN